ncbi:MAG: peptidylprolyl isomerase [Treponema sp.]|jgi:parvulin-like peptidyl-prolyl isomerase|nr:peptidylprolyl isomerase [Treponema sp.]
MASKAKKRSPENHGDSGFAEIIERFKSHPFLFGGTVAVLVLVIIAFVFLPAFSGPNREEAGGNLVFGYYDKKPIAYIGGNYFDMTLRAAAGAENFELNSDYSQDAQKASQVWYSAFIRTLVRMAILDEMKNASYTAPADKIDEQVASNFLEDGIFSLTKYRQADKAQLLSMWRSTEEDFITRQYINDLVNLQITEAEKAFAGGLASPERSFDMAVFPRSVYPGSEIEAFARTNPEPFKMVHLSKITIKSSEKDAQACLKSIKEGRSFEDAARNQSQDAYGSQGGDMGIKMAYEVYTDFSQEADRGRVLGLGAGALSEVLSVPLGWAIYRAEENPYPADLSVEAGLVKARYYMNRFEGGRIEDWLIAQAQALMAEAAAGGTNLYALISERAEAGGVEAGFPLRQFGPVNLNYGSVQLFMNTVDTNIPELASAPANENFWKNAFTTPLNSPSTPFTMGESIVVLIPTSETFLDDTDKKYISDWYEQGWMYDTLDSDLNSAFTGSKKFENLFYPVFLSRFNILNPLLNPENLDTGNQ